MKTCFPYNHLFVFPQTLRSNSKREIHTSMNTYWFNPLAIAMISEMQPRFNIGNKAPCYPEPIQLPLVVLVTGFQDRYDPLFVSNESFSFMGFGIPKNRFQRNKITLEFYQFSERLFINISKWSNSSWISLSRWLEISVKFGIHEYTHKNFLYFFFHVNLIQKN